MTRIAPHASNERERKKEVVDFLSLKCQLRNLRCNLFVAIIILQTAAHVAGKKRITSCQLRRHIIFSLTTDATTAFALSFVHPALHGHRTAQPRPITQIAPT